jgi:transcriptional regulator with XRE-family HTH domain
MRWTQVGFLKRKIKEYQARTGKTQAQVAADLGTTYGTLRFWLSGTRPPKRENIQKMISVLGGRLSDYNHDPGDLPSGVDPEAWAEAGEEDQSLVLELLDLIKDVPQNEKRLYVKLWKQGLELGRARIESENKNNGI